MDPRERETQREQMLATAVAWVGEAARLTSEANGIVCDQYYGLVGMIGEGATPEEVVALADIWTASTKSVGECVKAVADANQEIASIRARGTDSARLDEAWLAHRAANVARSLVRTKCLYAKMGEDSEEYNRICASVRMRGNPTPPDGWEPPKDSDARQDAIE